MDALRTLSYYYLGVPRPAVLEHRVFWTSERVLPQLLRQGRPVVVALLVPGCRFSEPFKDVLQRAAAEFAGDGIRFLQVDCSQAEEFCAQRHPSEFPFVEVFVPSTEPAPDGGKPVRRLQVLPYDYHGSVYGFRCFFRRHGLLGGKPAASDA